MTDVSNSLNIAILVIVVLVFLFQIELYRNLLSILTFYSPEAAPPAELRFSGSFLSRTKNLVKSEDPIRDTRPERVK